jgi:hypothetical protein
MTIDPFNEWDAAYVLGALSTDERREFERHFAGCANCASAVAELAGIPGILTMIDSVSAVTLMETPEDFNASQHNPELVQTLARLVSQEKRQSRRRVSIGLTGAAVVLIAFGVLAGSVIHTSRSSNNSTASIAWGSAVDMVPLSPVVMTAHLHITRKPWGTRFDWDCNYLGTLSASYSPNSYDLVITDVTGKRYTIATWSSPGPKADGLVATSSVSITNIRTVEIVATGSSVPLVRGQI